MNIIIIKLYCHIQRAWHDELECSLTLTHIVPICTIKWNMANKYNIYHHTSIPTCMYWKSNPAFVTGKSDVSALWQVSFINPLNAIRHQQDWWSVTQYWSVELTFIHSRYDMFIDYRISNCVRVHICRWLTTRITSWTRTETRWVRTSSTAWRRVQWNTSACCSPTRRRVWTAVCAAARATGNNTTVTGCHRKHSWPTSIELRE